MKQSADRCQIALNDDMLSHVATVFCTVPS